MDHLLKESKEQPEKVRPFIRFFSFVRLQSDLVLCVPGTIQRCHKARVPYDTRAVSFNMRRDL